MRDLQIVGVIAVCVACSALGIAALVRWIWQLDRHNVSDKPFSASDVSVEVDCRGCGQFNRVPSPRLLDRPKCARCKVRLMPRQHVVICRLRSMDGALRAELDVVWTNEDQLWQSLADHVALDGKPRDPRIHVVN